MDKNRRRYQKGDKVVLTGLRHAPLAEVTVNQPRSSTQVHVRELEGERINRHLHESSLTLHEDWVKAQAAATPPANDVVDRFRKALNDYLAGHTVPPKGRGHQKAVDEAYEYALTEAEARRYYDLGRGYVGRRLRAARSHKLGMSVNMPIPTADEEIGSSLITVGAQTLKAHYRQHKQEEEVIAAEVVEPAAAPVAQPRRIGRPKGSKNLPKLEIQVDIPAEVFAADYPTLIRQWLDERKENYALLPQGTFLHTVLGLDTNALTAVIQPYLEQGWRLAPTGFGLLLIRPLRLKADAKTIITEASDADLQELLSLVVVELGNRLAKKETPGQ